MRPGFWIWKPFHTSKGDTKCRSKGARLEDRGWDLLHNSKNGDEDGACSPHAPQLCVESMCRDRNWRRVEEDLATVVDGSVHGWKKMRECSKLMWLLVLKKKTLKKIMKGRAERWWERGVSETFFVLTFMLILACINTRQIAEKLIRSDTAYVNIFDVCPNRESSTFSTFYNGNAVGSFCSYI